MKVRIDTSRRFGKFHMVIGGKRAVVKDGNVVLKPRHLKLLGFVGRKSEDYVLLGGRTLAHACRDGMFVTIRELPLPPFPDKLKDFEFSAEIEVLKK